MRQVCLCVLITAILHVTARAQTAAPVPQGNPAVGLWQIRSQTITNDLIKDATDFAPFRRAMLWARLAQRWSRDDPERSRAWIAKAIDVVQAVPNKENPGERMIRLNATRSLLNIIAPLDQKLSQRLVSVLSDDAEHAVEAERTANAEGLVEAAISVVDKDPQRGAELGALALRVGRPTQITWLISRLRSKDARLGDALFAKTVELARQTTDTNLINSLSNWIFPEIQPGAPMSGLPDEMRTELLKLDLAFLQANPINPENRDSTCMGIISFIAPVLGHFQRLLPQQAPIARQAINQCQSKFPLAQERIDEALNDQPLNTVEALLKAGDDNEDPLTRTVFHYRAAALAKDKDDFEQALKILDSMNAEARGFMSGAWEYYRWHWATLAALRYFKNGDLNAMRLIINAVPSDLQPFARIGFVGELPDERNQETDPTLEFLSDARVGLRRSKISENEKWSYYLALLKLTVKYQPAEAMGDLKEAVAALNRLEQSKAEDRSNEHPNTLGGAGFSEAFPAALIDMDDYAVRETVSTITSPDSRVQVRLELLRVCLEQMRNSRQGKPTASQRAAKSGEKACLDRTQKFDIRNFHPPCDAA